MAPMVKIDDGYIPDYNSRYFLEDFPHGLQYIHNMCVKYGIDNPMIEKVLKWGISSIKKSKWEK